MNPNPARASDQDVAELDLREEVCPYTFLKARLALESMALGDVLRVLVGNEASAHDVPRSLADAGHAVLATEPAGEGLWAVTVRKRSSSSALADPSLRTGP